MANPLRSSLRQLANYQDGYIVTQTITILGKAKDHYDQDRELFVYNGVRNGIDAKIRISSGARAADQKLVNMYNGHNAFAADDNILSVYPISDVKISPDDSSSSCNTVKVLATENYQSNLQFMIEWFKKIDDLSLFVKLGNEYEMNERLQQILLTIGETINNVCGRHYRFSNLRLTDICLRVDDNGKVTVKLASLMLKKDDDVKAKANVQSCRASSYLAHVLEQIFTVADVPQCMMVKDFINQLRDLDNIPQRYFRHPIFLNAKKRRVLIYDVATYQTHKDPYKILQGKYSLSWTKHEEFKKMIDQHRKYDDSFMSFVLFVKDKLVHFSDVSNKDAVGRTEEEFLQYVAKEIPFFWSAIGELVVA